MVVWLKLKDNSLPLDGAFDTLVGLRDKGVKLTRRSVELINIEDLGKRTEFVDSVKGTKFGYLFIIIIYFVIIIYYYSSSLLFFIIIIILLLFYYSFLLLLFLLFLLFIIIIIIY